uniref:BOP1 ribosomal biogenesis factor n=1 Tax=Anser cygnoides TaxID=8845 RepID=A0A8B9EPL4_ANSCY
MAPVVPGAAPAPEPWDPRPRADPGGRGGEGRSEAPGALGAAACSRCRQPGTAAAGRVCACACVRVQGEQAWPRPSENVRRAAVCGTDAGMRSAALLTARSPCPRARQAEAGLQPTRRPGARSHRAVGSFLHPAVANEPGSGASCPALTLPSCLLPQDIRNTVGNIPMEWYEDFPHIGYDLDGKKIYKPIRNKDELDKFLEKMENPDYWRTVQDKMTGADIKLTDEQVDLVQRLQKGQFGDVHFDPYEPAVDFFTHEVMIHPVTNRPADKRSFIPSLIEKEKVRALPAPCPEQRWRRWLRPLSWPRRAQQPSCPRRRVPLLWQCGEVPAEVSRSVTGPSPASCLPPQVYRGHTSLVRCLSISPSGQWLASGSDDCTVRFWEVCTARCMKTLPVGSVVKSIAWNPNPTVCLVAICVEQSVLLVNPCLGDKLLYGATDQVLESYVPPEEERVQPVQWVTATIEEHSKGIRLTVQHSKALKQVTWHGKGDYFATVVSDNSNMQVLIHQTSKRWSQNPFRKSKGLVQCVLFHPIRPYFFVATQRYVRVYNLLKQELTKKLMANCKWVSSMAIHPGGDNVICGSYDSKLAWFDLDLSTRPYQLLRHHKKALRSVAFHKHYPLFASGSDDGTVIVCHGMVYNDLLQNPLLVPVKVLKGHALTLDLGVLDVLFHPTQPWVFSSGADGTVRLFT